MRTCHRFVVLVVLCSLAFLTYLDRICIMRVQGDIEHDFQFGKLSAGDEQRLRNRGLENDTAARAKLSRDHATERMSWVFSAFVAGYVLFEIPMGWLGDVRGPRWVIFRIVLCWSVFTSLTGGVRGMARLFSARPSPELLLGTLITVRFLFGMAEAGAYPNIARALGRWFPIQERATAQSFIWFSSRLGGAAAPAIISCLMALAGAWHRAFWLLGGIGVLWAIFFVLWFRDRPEDNPSVNALECEWIRGDSSEMGSIYNDRRPPRLPWKSLISANLLALNLASFSVSFCFYFYITFLPAYLKDQFGFDYGQSQLLTGLPLLFGAIACVLGGRMSDHLIQRTGNKRFGRGLMPFLGWSAAGLCALLVSQLHTPALIIILICVAFIFQDLGVPSMWSIPADVGGCYAGTVGGCMNTAGAIGGILSSLIAAKVSIAFGWNVVFVIFGCVYFLGALAWLRINASEPVLSSE